MPKLTLITVTYNAGRFLERTLRSIQAAGPQPELEYLLIDGGSTDNTLDLVRQQKGLITHWISEPDRGLYDAMNKGLDRARGDYVWFLNAGDEIHDTTTLPALLRVIEAEKADVYYSDALFVGEDGRVVGLRSEVTPHTLPRHLTWHDMALGMKVCHQAFIVKRSLAPPYRIDNLSADVDWEIRCLKKAQKITFLPFILCNYLTGGLSVQRHRQSLIDRFEVLTQHFGLVATLWNHLRISLRAVQFSIKHR